jgi:hypothetical protein
MNSKRLNLTLTHEHEAVGKESASASKPSNPFASAFARCISSKVFLPAAALRRRRPRSRRGAIV